jgi:hypothetical protein
MTKGPIIKYKNAGKIFNSTLSNASFFCYYDIYEATSQ